MSHSVWNNNAAKSSPNANRDKGFNNDDIALLAKMSDSPNGLDKYILGLKKIYDNVIKNQKKYDEFVERKVNPISKDAKNDLSILDFEDNTEDAEDKKNVAFFIKIAEWYGNHSLIMDSLNEITFFEFSDYSFYLELDKKIRLLYKIDRHIVDEFYKWSSYSGVITMRTMRDMTFKKLEHFTKIYYAFVDKMDEISEDKPAQPQQPQQPTQVVAASTSPSSPQISMPALKRVSILHEKVTINTKWTLNEIAITCMASPAPSFSSVFERDGDVIIRLVITSAGRTYVREIPIYSIHDSNFTASANQNYRTIICKHVNCNFAECSFVHQDELPNLKWLTSGNRSLPSPNAICSMLRTMIIDPNYNGEGTLIAQNSSF
jgi:hypothetical protein